MLCSPLSLFLTLLHSPTSLHTYVHTQTHTSIEFRKALLNCVYSCSSILLLFICIILHRLSTEGDTQSCLESAHLPLSLPPTAILHWQRFSFLIAIHSCPFWRLSTHSSTVHCCCCCCCYLLWHFHRGRLAFDPLTQQRQSFLQIRLRFAEILAKVQKLHVKRVKE